MPITLTSGAKKVYKPWPEYAADPGLWDDEAASADVALGYIAEAWELALSEGIEPEMIANAALFAAMSDLVTLYGETAVMTMAEGLRARIERGEFTIKGRLQ
jgi:hypothetical protein